MGLLPILKRPLIGVISPFIISRWGSKRYGLNYLVFVVFSTPYSHCFTVIWTLPPGRFLSHGTTPEPITPELELASTNWSLKLMMFKKWWKALLFWIWEALFCLGLHMVYTGGGYFGVQMNFSKEAKYSNISEAQPIRGEFCQRSN